MEFKLEKKDLTVTSVRKKVKGYDVMLSDGSNILVNEELLIEYRLIVGNGINYEELDDINNKVAIYEAYQDGLSYVLKYYNPSSKVCEHLQKKGYTYATSKTAVDMLVSKKLIDDEKYRSVYISKLIRDGFGLIVILARLKERGLDTEDINPYDITSCEDYKEALNDIAHKKLRTLKDNKKLRLYQYLFRRGYSVDDIKAELKGVNFESEDI